MKCVLLLLAVVLLSGCAQNLQGSTESVTPLTAEGDVYKDFAELQRQIDVLVADNSPIGEDHYNKIKENLLMIESKGAIPEKDIQSAKQKLEMLTPSGSTGTPEQAEVREESSTGCGSYDVFSALEHEINALYEGQNVIGQDKYQQLKEALECFSKTNDVADLMQKLEAIASRQAVRDSNTLTPAEQADKEIFDQLPDCAGQKFSVSPIDMSKLAEIYALGNTAPPGHTLPTEHMYFHISPGGSTTTITDLRAPGDIYLISVSGPSNLDIVPGNDDFSMGFALCKDVFGYYNHVKTLSDEIKSVVRSQSCESCSKRFVYKISAGTVIGGVGHLQGNFDLGAYDYRTKNNFANPSRYGDVSATGFGRPRSFHIMCPLDLYTEPVKSQLFGKITRTDKACGIVMQDISGTLQGNWFYGSGTTIYKPEDWEKHLAFVYDNKDPSKAVVVIGGVIASAKKIMFSPQTSGTINRKFSDVKPGSDIYCYHADGEKVLVQMNSETAIKIEYKPSSCSTGESFSSPVVYER